MVNIAILGFGVVGSGVAEVLATNNDLLEKRLQSQIKLKKILDVRDFSGSAFEALVTKDFHEIVEDEEIKIVVETIGGVGIAYQLTKEALAHSKSVVTSNKELVAKHGVELMALARENQCSYWYEASVGGGIPIIQPMYTALVGNQIQEIIGIVNGTTNYILTQMEQSGKEFNQALAEAQEMGYAEQDSSTDLMGLDSQRKLAILSTIALDGKYVDAQSIYTQGITHLTGKDFLYAHAMDCKIKLLAQLKQDFKGGFYSIVAPFMLSKTHPVAVADGVFNSILVKGNAVGDIMVYGQGAGKLATASAVVGDIMEAAKNIGQKSRYNNWYFPDISILNSHSDATVQALIRIKGAVDPQALGEFISLSIDQMVSLVPEETAICLGRQSIITEAKLEEILAKIGGKYHIESWIRILS